MAWRAGVGGEEKDRAADLALHMLEEGLDPDAFALALALLNGAAEESPRQRGRGHVRDGSKMG